MNVVIIGAGVAGLGIGWRLAKAGAKVTVLERAQVGNGATTASAGMIAAAAELAQAGGPEAVLAAQAARLWPGFAAELRDQTGIDVGYRKPGALLVRMKGAPEMPGPASDVVERLDALAARVLEPRLGPGIADALLAADEGQVDSQALCRALAVALVRAGGQVLSNEAVVRFERQADRVVGATTPFATYGADAFVLAAGAWTSRIVGLPPEIVPPVTPVKGEIAVLSPPPGAAPPDRVVWGNGIYLTPRRGRLLVGATMERAGFDTALTRKALNWLFARSTALMPSLKDWTLTGHWAGLRPASPDGLPILGPAALAGLYVASGQFRNGILFAPAISEVLSRLVLERTAVDAAFDPRRFAGFSPVGPDPVAETPHREASGEAGEWRTGS